MRRSGWEYPISAQLGCGWERQEENLKFARPLRRLAKALLPPAFLMRRRARKAMAGEGELRAAVGLSRGRLFIDVGANEGAWSCAAAPAFREVHAFEPHPVLAGKIRRLLPSNVTVYNVALSDREGTTELYVPLIDGMETISRASLEEQANGSVLTSPHTVERHTLDSFDFSGVDVIKIDVEGHEASVIHGAEQTLLRERPAVIMEIEERHHEGQSESIIAWVRARNYDCFYLSEAGPKRFQPGEIERLQPHRHSRLGNRQQNYVNNFIFIPSEHSDLRARLERLR